MDAQNEISKKQIAMITIFHVVFGLAGLCVAYKRKSKGWGYLGWYLLLGMVGSGVGYAISLIAVKEDDEEETNEEDDEEETNEEDDEEETNEFSGRNAPRVDIAMNDFYGRHAPHLDMAMGGILNPISIDKFGKKAGYKFNKFDNLSYNEFDNLKFNYTAKGGILSNASN